MRKLLVSCFAFIALSNAAGCGEDGPLKVVPDRQGGRGEGCLVTNDCKSGLLCIEGSCVSEDFALEATTKVCSPAECIDAKDCCDSEPCTYDCEDHVCVSTEVIDPDQCTIDEDCAFFGGMYCVSGACVACKQTSDCITGSVCVQGACAECGKDADCGAGNICELGSCEKGCVRDEACGAMQACKSGRCEARNCLSDRECVAAQNRPDAVCAESGECAIPCDSNGGCISMGGLYSCVEGYCKYAGCETNAECSAAQEDQAEGLMWLCLSQEEAAKIPTGF